MNSENVLWSFKTVYLNSDLFGLCWNLFSLCCMAVQQGSVSHPGSLGKVHSGLCWWSTLILTSLFNFFPSLSLVSPHLWVDLSPTKRCTSFPSSHNSKSLILCRLLHATFVTLLNVIKNPSTHQHIIKTLKLETGGSHQEVSAFNCLLFCSVPICI